MPLEPRKSPRLQEVEDDAVRITTKRFKDQEDERQYQLAKKAGKPQVSAEVEPELEATTPNTKGK